MTGYSTYFRNPAPALATMPLSRRFVGYSTAIAPAPGGAFTQIFSECWNTPGGDNPGWVLPFCPALSVVAGPGGFFTVTGVPTNRGRAVRSNPDPLYPYTVELFTVFGGAPVAGDTMQLLVGLVDSLYFALNPGLSGLLTTAGTYNFATVLSDFTGLHKWMIQIDALGNPTLFKDDTLVPFTCAPPSLCGVPVTTSCGATPPGTTMEIRARLISSPSISVGAVVVASGIAPPGTIFTCPNGNPIP